MKKCIILILLFIWYFQVHSQSNDYNAVPASGDYFSSAEYSLSWTLGECITETYHDNEIILTQGFQQSMFLITSLDEFTIEGFSVKVYPNPFTDCINILAAYSTVPDISIRVELFDANGKVLFIDKFSSNRIRIDMTGYLGGVYFLKVVNTDNKLHRNFKILKIK